MTQNDVTKIVTFKVFIYMKTNTKSHIHIYYKVIMYYTNAFRLQLFSQAYYKDKLMQTQQ